MKAHKIAPQTLRRSIVLPRSLLEEALRCGGTSQPTNVNRLVREALVEFVDRRKRAGFAAEMAEMARDPQIRAATRAILDASCHQLEN